MTHTRQMDDSEGTFGGWSLTKLKCPQCGEQTIRVRGWESNDGAYQDQQFKCFGLTCAHTWWVDGIDS